MSIEANEVPAESKGEKIKREVEAKLTPSQRESLAVDIVKDSEFLTKVRIRRKLKERGEGTTAADSGA